jgi:hypothetical protein
MRSQTRSALFLVLASPLASAQTDWRAATPATAVQTLGVAMSGALELVIGSR